MENLVEDASRQPKTRRPGANPLEASTLTSPPPGANPLGAVAQPTTPTMVQTAQQPEARGRLEPAPAWCRWIANVTPRYRRLRGSITTLRARLDKARGGLPAGVQPPTWLAAAERLCDEADLAMSVCSLDEGWRCLHAAQRETFFGMDDAALDTLAAVLEQEAEDEDKFPPWRAGAMKAAAAAARAENDAASKAQLLGQGFEIRDERFETIYYNYSLARHQLVILSGVLFVLMVATLYLMVDYLMDENHRESAGISSVTSNPSSVLAVALLGAIGATVSAIMSFANTRPNDRIPERTINMLVTFARPLVGAASALIVVFAFESQLIASPETEHWLPFIWVSAFASGFSERLVMRAVDAPDRKQN